MNIFAHHGIIHRLICPILIIKTMLLKKHRHIVLIGLTLLNHASFPLQFWDYAFVTAVYLINRLATTSLNFAFHIKFFYKTLDV